MRKPTVVIELVLAFVLAADFTVVFNFAVVGCEGFSMTTNDPEVVILPDNSMSLSLFGHFTDH